MSSNTLRLLLVILLGGCSGGDDAALPVPNLRHADLENRLRLHGFRDLMGLRRLVLELRQAAERGDKSTLASAIHYPLRRYDSGILVGAYRGPAEVLANFDAVFSAKVLAALRDASFDQLFVRDQGAMIGDGEVWLNVYEEGLKIKAINS